MRESKTSLYPDDRVWYDQFTSTDWVHDSIADAYRVKALRSRKDLRGRIKCFFDGAQGWILSAVVGFLTAVIAYVVDVSEAPVFDWKDGYCSTGFLISEKVSPGNMFCFVVPTNLGTKQLEFYTTFTIPFHFSDISLSLAPKIIDGPLVSSSD